MQQRDRFVFAALVIVTSRTIATSVHAQWTVTYLHPAGARQSDAYGVFDGVQVGDALMGAINTRACMWHGTAESFVNITPASAGYHASAHGICAEQQVGSVLVDGNARAGFWSGSADTWVYLDDFNSTGSAATCCDGGQQGGYRSSGGYRRASLWSGTAESRVELHRGGGFTSGVFAMHAGEQVGDAHVGSEHHASLWRGSAASWVDLNPAGSTSSIARGVHDGVAGGWARIGGVIRAGIWTGSAASWVELHPPGATESVVHGVFAGRQVGAATIDGLGRAGMWNGSAASWEDLSAVLAGGPWAFGNAFGIWSDDEVIQLVGSAWNTSLNRYEALLWTRCTTLQSAGNLDGDADVDLSDLALLLSDFGCAAPEPCAADLDQDGDTDAGDLAILLAEFGVSCN